ncbi:anti-sigma factor [Williamsia sp. CHRR-6]|uniref:anti-sigma factor family protein n=1 Tax=Williamsia sp. CHRR-6 TaxID=2835871 RepID=UPI001BD93F96|nr:hypothetical protein [Williamsia sp. CHRR-6]MBT0568469.1 hypothetical protein [Williamsia sp. CHRR-6]
MADHDRPQSRGFSSWAPAATSFTANSRYRAPGTPGGRRFAPTDHLATEAVAAFVDGELRMSAHLRAARHIAACPECAAEVDSQMSARSVLRSSPDVTMPAALLGQLSEIPTREIDLRASPGNRGGEAPDAAAGDSGPLAAPGFPVHRTSRWRTR